MEDFESLLNACRGALQRFIRCHVSDISAWDDIEQETLLSACAGFGRLSSPESFRPWLLGIARHKCQDYYRARRDHLPLEDAPESALLPARCGLIEPVRETMEALPNADRSLLEMFYYEGLPQKCISARLGVPIGTVKSRLSAARTRFRALYPCPPKGEKEMFKLPEIMPAYTIARRDDAPFPVRWEEMMGWFIVPREGERMCWAMYDYPGRRRGEYVEMSVEGRAEVHGLVGVSIRAREYDPQEANRVGDADPVERWFVAQLTDTHCRILAESHVEDGVRRIHTFLDGERFLPNWGFGENNCGNEICVVPRGDITRDGDVVTARDKPFLLDVVGRYDVTIAGRTFDTLCVMDVETYNDGVCSEQFIDRRGRTVLWRRFNRDDWAIARYGKPWSERLPDSETLRVNGALYVHWYDCLTDAAL